MGLTTEKKNDDNKPQIPEQLCKFARNSEQMLKYAKETEKWQDKLDVLLKDVGDGETNDIEIEIDKTQKIKR